jgi:hypothetical protein
VTCVDAVSEVSALFGWAECGEQVGGVGGGSGSVADDACLPPFAFDSLIDGSA